MRRLTIVPILFLAATLLSSVAQGVVALTTLDQYVVAHGYGGAQFILHENAYRLPIVANGKAGDLTIDTGAPTSVVFKAAVKKFGLSEEGTDMAVHGAFGKGTEKLGLTSVHQLAMGNCKLMNVKAVVLSDPDSGGLYRRYGLSDGLFGLREMLKYGAVLDISNNLLLVHPGGQVKSISGWDSRHPNETRIHAGRSDNHGRPSPCLGDHQWRPLSPCGGHGRVSHGA